MCIKCHSTILTIMIPCNWELCLVNELLTTQLTVAELIQILNGLINWAISGGIEI